MSQTNGWMVMHMSSRKRNENTIQCNDCNAFLRLGYENFQGEGTSWDTPSVIVALPGRRHYRAAASPSKPSLTDYSAIENLYLQRTLRRPAHPTKLGGINVSMKAPHSESSSRPFQGKYADLLGYSNSKMEHNSGLHSQCCVHMLPYISLKTCPLRILFSKKFA